jgi:signal transduction histidine kinase/CheY-like chemotaxis protein
MLLSAFSFFNINQRFISFLNTNLEQQTIACGERMEEELQKFENDLNKLLYQYRFSEIFTNQGELENSQDSLEVLYYKYRDLVTNVFIFDNQKNYFGLYINKNDEFVVDTFPRQRQQQLSPRHRVEENNGKYLYHYPFFKNDQVSGNIIVEVDFEQFAKELFSFYPVGKTISWQWVLSNGEIIGSGFPDSARISSLGEIADSIEMFSSGVISHTLTIPGEKKQRLYSAYYPMSILGKHVGIVFSISQTEFNRFFIYKNSLVSSAAFLITIAVILYLLVMIGRGSRSQEKLMMSEIVFRQIIEKFPVGIMILDAGNIIRNINSAAQRMMCIDRKENLVGQDYNNSALFPNKFLLHGGSDTINGVDYLHYEKDGIETILYRLEEVTRIGGEELRLVALVDVSSIERSRKQEVAANRAKSDFLASMSHEIRTPMNGILGMVGQLMQSKMPPPVEEKVKIIKKSSDLLMTILNDILDFSRIEAGKMILEEIPFHLREEVAYTVELFRPLAEKKGLLLEQEIKPAVPERLIGDPFRLRQVISNLLSNAIKFTEKGKVAIFVDVIDHVKEHLQLLFRVEDTGIGIPADKITSIFDNYAQSGSSVTRLYGGTGLGIAISKELVELMNGELWAESPVRQGTPDQAPGSRFSFTIEVFSNEKLPKDYSFAHIEQLNQITALYITREPTPERNNINKLFNQFGINIVTKIYQDSNMDSVVHHLNVKKNLYQFLVIADKAGMEGFGIASKLKTEGLMDLFPCIMVCSNDKPGNYRLTRKLGIDYYLIEPFESKEVYDIVRETFPNLRDHKSIVPILHTLPPDLSILLVEDNLINQKVAQSIFKNIGYEIDIASDGEEAVKKTLANRYDIIFMDLYLPKLDGFEATEKIRKNGITLPVVAMSADVDDQQKARSVQYGMDDFLTKPARVEQVKQVLIKYFSSAIK